MKVIHCWPKEWIEAAQKTGFAIYKGDGRFEFISDKMRDLLQEFAELIAKSEAKAFRNEIEPYLIAASDGSMSRNNSEQLADELLEWIRSRCEY